MKALASLLLFVSILAFAPACTPVKNAGAALADSEISLTTAVQVADNALDAACADVKSDRCGRALNIHEKVLKYANVAYSTIKTGRSFLAKGDTSGAWAAVERVNGLVININNAIKGG